MTVSRGGRTALRRSAAALAVVVTIGSCSTADAPSSTAEGSANSSAAIPAAVAGCASFAADGGTVGEGEGLPALRLPCLVEGEDVFLDDLGDRPVLVNLWATWCAPCREEMPLLQETYQRNGDRVGFLGVLTQDTPSAAASLLDDLDVTYAHVVDRDKRLLIELSAPGLPVTLAVAADGRILDRQIGPVTAARLEELVSLLAEDDAGAP